MKENLFFGKYQENWQISGKLRKRRRNNINFQYHYEKGNCTIDLW